MSRFVAPQKHTLRLRQPKLCKPESSAKTNTFASSGAETCSAFVQASFLSLRFDVAHAYWRAAEEADHVSESSIVHPLLKKWRIRLSHLYFRG